MKYVCICTSFVETFEKYAMQEENCVLESEENQ